MTKALPIFSSGSPLVRLRAAMQAAQVDACLIPSADPHLSEYLPAYWQVRAWLTPFTGSVGTVVVTKDFAGLWVDSRYWVQAENELAGSEFQLMKIGTAADAAHTTWLAQHIRPHGVVAVDGRALGLAARDVLKSLFAEKHIQLELGFDLPGQCWTDRPSLPMDPVYEFAVDIAGQSRIEKLARVRQVMKEQGAQWHLISTVDDIGWLLNLRGSDVAYNPVFLSHVLIGEHGAHVFVLSGKINAELTAILAKDNIEVHDYDHAAKYVCELPGQDALMYDPLRTTCALVDRISARCIPVMNPSTYFKSQKTDAEIARVRQVMEKDGAALCAFFAWLEDAIERADLEPLHELMIDERLIKERSAQNGFVSRSFGTIAAFNANGAMPHYRPTTKSNARIHGSGLLLIDSGGQYLGGTTDITRVVPVGEITQDQKSDYTAVLRAMISLSRLKFPRGIASPMIDAVARAPIWDRLAEYGHGTGHGVGYFMNVHEGPQVISYRAAAAPHTAMQPGMITSNEPGLYRPGRWGIRIENLICNQPAGTSEFGEFLQFETLTLCPIDTRCIQLDQMKSEEIEWLNAYHAEVRRRLMPNVSGAALKWLLLRTEALV